MGVNMSKSLQRDIETSSGNKIAYSFILSIVALGLMCFEYILMKGKVGCTQAGCMKILGSLTGILSVVAIVGLPVYTLTILKVCKKLKNFVVKLFVALIPSAIVMTPMILIFNVYILEFVPYILLALYPFVLIVANVASDYVKSDDTRDLLNIFPIILFVGYIFISGYALLSLS
jgi:succinate dehydrogenase hydrophobic anchor subunit